MESIRHRHVDTNGITMHVAESGPDDGHAVVLCHGFPECWYSWRHQLAALGAAGYHVVAPDQRGYGGTDMPRDVGAYTQLHLVGDVVGLLHAIGVERATVVGHDWGAPVAWNCALLRPDLFGAVAALSVQWGGVHPRAVPAAAPSQALRSVMGDGFLYVLHFQEPGVAEAELDVDIRRTLRAFLYSLSGDIPRSDYRFFDPDASGMWDVLTDPPGQIPWLSDDDLDVFVDSFAQHGTFFGGLNWYRCIDRNDELRAPLAGRTIDQPALFVGAEFDSIFGQTKDAVLATRAHVPNLRDLVWVEGSGHWIQQERPEVVNAALLDFLADVTT
jgi:pimeloyl-ACP methyl ester carboxylesterase